MNIVFVAILAVILAAALLWLVCETLAAKSQEVFWLGEAKRFEQAANLAQNEAAYHLQTSGKNYDDASRWRSRFEKEVDKLVKERAVNAALSIGYTRAFALETPKMAHVGRQFLRVLRNAAKEASDRRNA